MKIVVASVLKPANDVRMCSKLGKSLLDSGNFELYSIGAYCHANNVDGITLCVLPLCTRLSWRRIWQPLRVFAMLWKIKPQLVIVGTHELLWVGVMMKLLTRCKLIYDVQENYYRNILFTNAFPKLLRHLLAFYVRAKEIILAPAIDYFVLAEKCYQQELFFVAKKNIVVENKVELPEDSVHKRVKQKNEITLLFTGTLAESTGVFSAINLVKKLHAHNPAVSLKLIGYCSQQITFEAINHAITDCHFITLTGGNFLMPHQNILEAISQADFGIIAYPPNRSTENKIPTKLYEYMGYQLPILLINHAKWIRMCEPYPASIITEFENPDVPSILNDMQYKKFYQIPPFHGSWQEERISFINLVNRLLK